MISNFTRSFGRIAGTLPENSMVKVSYRSERNKHTVFFYIENMINNTKKELKYDFQYVKETDEDDLCLEMYREVLSMYKA